MKFIKTSFIIAGIALLMANLVKAAELSAEYSYDVNGRLTEVQFGSKRIIYTYDANGNLLQRTIQSGASSAVERDKTALIPKESAEDPEDKEPGPDEEPPKTNG